MTRRYALSWTRRGGWHARFAGSGVWGYRTPWALYGAWRLHRSHGNPGRGPGRRAIWDGTHRTAADPDGHPVSRCSPAGCGWPPGGAGVRQMRGALADFERAVIEGDQLPPPP